jgi:hypothetical protein
MACKLAGDIPEQAADNYLTMVKDMVRADGPVYVDDTDVIKPYGKLKLIPWRKKHQLQQSVIMKCWMKSRPSKNE